MGRVVVDVQEERRVDRVNKGIAGNGSIPVAQSRRKFGYIEIRPNCDYDEGERIFGFDSGVGHCRKHRRFVYEVLGGRGVGPDY